MSEDQVFRERVEPVAETPIEATNAPLEEGVSGAEMPTRALHDWETESGEYILTLFDIKETHKEMPLKIHFGSLNKYVQAEIKERGWAENKKNFQAILSEIENELGTARLETYERMRKIYEYLQVKKKYTEAKKKLDSYKSP